jgi:hypothetical protein
LVDIGPPVPSIPYLCRALVDYIANHPLIINPPVYHPETGEQVFIDRYKTFPGLYFDEGLLCSVFGYYSSDGAPLAPGTNRVSAMYEVYNIGQTRNEDHVVYNIVIGLQHNSVMVPVDDGKTVSTWAEAPLDYSQVLLTSNARKEVPLIINPSVNILGEYLEILRLVVSDPVYKRFMPIRCNSFEALYANLKAGRWEKDKNVYFHEAELLVRLDGYISRGWRDRFDVPVTNIEANLTINE